MAVLGGLAIMNEMMNNGMMWGMGIWWLNHGHHRRARDRGLGQIPVFSLRKTG
jgi:hypothetical protein